MLEKKDEQKCCFYEKMFEIYLKSPFISTLIIWVASFILGIVCVAFKIVIGWLISWVIGAIYGALNYYIVQIIISSRALNVLYLKTISLGLMCDKKNNNDIEIKKESLLNINNLQKEELQETSNRRKESCNKYIKYLSENSLYVEKSPILIETMAIVENNTTGEKHIQLKLKNLVNKRIGLVKVKIFLYDIIGREVEIIEKQYVELNAKRNKSFASDIGIPFQSVTAQKVVACIKEVSFHDGSIWTCEREQWEVLPKQKTLLNVLDDDNVVDELHHIYGQEMKYLPLKYKDLWLCSCGCVNKNDEEYCLDCGINFFEENEIDYRKLRNDNIYRKGIELTKKNNLADIKKGIKLLESISDEVECSFSIGEAKFRLESLKAEER